MTRSVSMNLVRVLVALSLSSSVLAAGDAPGAAPPKEEAPLDPARIRSAIAAVKEAPPAERRKAAAGLIALGPGALAESRRARDEAADPESKAALDRAVRWILAAKMKPVLLERYASNLTFDGQYEDLKSEGLEAAAALLGMFDDEETPAGLRLAAAHALADLRDPSILSSLRRLEQDPLFAAPLREEAATLLAILGDTSVVDQKIKKLLPKAEKTLAPIDKSSNVDALNERLNLGFQRALDNIELSNQYYRIRQYPKAIACYDRAIESFEELRRLGSPIITRQLNLDERLALAYYNAACSLSLNGEIDRGREMLKKAVGMDPRHLKSMDKDGDLRNLRNAPGYAEFKRGLEKPLEDKQI
jgi:tetratricopeptide (TPR) repeat protein